MNIAEMTMADLDARQAEITAELDGADEARLAELKAEAEQISARRAELQEAEERAKQAEMLNTDTVEPDRVIEQNINPVKENRTMYDLNSVEYRDAFAAVMLGRATEEQRTIAADNSAAGDGYSLPVALDTQIWDQVAAAHPILADVSVLKTGCPIKVTKATPAAISSKLDSATTSEQSITFVEVTLNGADYGTYVTLTYAAAKMSQGAFEKYLVKEVADAIGLALAKAIFARILSDASANEVSMTSGTDTYYESIKEALGKASLATNAVIYANPEDYYAITGEVDSNGQPIIRDGVALGAVIKKDSAATKITIVDPGEFVLNVVQDVMVESQKDVKLHQFVIGAYARAEGCLRKTNAASFITVS